MSTQPRLALEAEQRTAELTDWHKLHGDAFKNATALVTGGAGFIGSHLTEALIRLGANVIAFDDLSGGSTDNFNSFRELAGKRLQFIKGTIMDQSALDKAVTGCTYVFHQAALASVPASVAEPRLFTEVNVMGTLNVLEAARKAGVKRVMFAASSSAYGDSPTLPKIESMPPMSKSPYAATKLADEQLLSAYSASYGLDTAALRYFNIFGPRQNANSAYAAVIAAFAKSLLELNSNPLIYGDGEQSRDFTFVHNAVHANLLAARSKTNIDGQAINVACGLRVTVNELATQMVKMIGKPQLTPVYKDERAGDVKHSLADLTLAQKVLGYEPIVDLETGLKVTVQWYQGMLSK